MTLRPFPDAARRARLARRHALHPDHRVDTPVQSAEAARLTGYLGGLVVPNPYAGRLREGVPLP